MTRAYPMQNVEGEKQDHPHHRSVCFGLHSANGFNTWHEVLTFTKKGKVDPHKAAHLGHQVHTKVSKAEASGNSATLVVESENVSPKGEAYMRQTRTMNFHVADNGSRVMDIEIALKGIQDKITIHDMKDSGLSVRVAHSMCVDADEGGRIINMSSVVGHTGNGGQSMYAATKGGITAFTKSIAADLAPFGILANCVAPGFIGTEMTDALPEEAKDAIMTKIPMGRLGNADEVANVVCFLSSDKASYITGSTIHVNGGMYTN